MAVEAVLPFYGGVELALEVCPEHRDAVERAIEAVGDVVFQAGLNVAKAGAAWGAGEAS